MRFWKLPPRIKILEALGSIADKRISILSEKSIDGKTVVKAICISSEKNKVYNIIYIPEDNAIFADDNGSRFRGYLGYPSIALLMLKKVLSYSPELSLFLKDIPWKKMNEKFKNYYKTESEVKKMLERKGISEKKVDKFIEKVMEEIKQKKLAVLKNPEEFL
jgi:hypothetical protein